MMANVPRIAFPTLDGSQMAEIAKCASGSLKRYRAGEYLFQTGERDFKFFVVKSGEVEIVDESGDEPVPVTIHRAGEFTGDISTLTGSASIVSARARTGCEAYE